MFFNQIVIKYFCQPSFFFFFYVLFYTSSIKKKNIVSSKHRSYGSRAMSTALSMQTCVHVALRGNSFSVTFVFSRLILFQSFGGGGPVYYNGRSANAFACMCIIIRTQPTTTIKHTYNIAENRMTRIPNTI